MGEMIDGVSLTPLKIIDVEAGDVLHCMKKTDPSFAGFGEAYFSTIQEGQVKGWKKHTSMTLNLVVPIGLIRFVIFDDRDDSATKGQYQEVALSRENYQRLTVPPMLWMAFQGLSAVDALLLNIASIPHRPEEAVNSDLSTFAFDWSKRL